MDENNQRKLSPEMTETLQKHGLLEEQEIKNEARRRKMREQRKAAYHNTAVLLKNYREIVWQAECEASRVAEELELPLRNIDALLSRIDAEIGMKNRKIEVDLERLLRYRALIDRVNEAVSLLKKRPGNGKKLYELIYITYISPDKLDVSEILYRMDLSYRHYYRLREEALNILAIRLWAAPSPEWDIWLELAEKRGGEQSDQANK